MNKNKKKSLKTSFAVMTVIPILILGVVIALFSAERFKKSIYEEIHSELKNTAYMIVNTYDRMYPGDYRIVDNKTLLALKKGDYYMASSQDYLDNLKEDTGYELTFFYGDIRYVTTLTDENGERIIGTRANAAIRIDVIENDCAHFYENVNIFDTKVCAYYMPLHNSDGSCVGMITVMKNVSEVKNLVFETVMPILIISFIITIMAGCCVLLYTSSVLRAFGRIKNFLMAVESGDLDKQIDDVILMRNDEIGYMGKAAVNMQGSIKQLVEKDSLTMLYNRRYADDRLLKMMSWPKTEKDKMLVAIADIDFFKKINDTYGHMMGDRVLVKTADILKKHMVSKGFAARWGGEEFLLVYENVKPVDAYNDLCNLLNKINDMEIESENGIIHITMSIGGAGITKNIQSLDEIIKEADSNLYYAKNNGRNQVRV